MKYYTRDEIKQIRLDTADPFWLPDGKTDWPKRILHGVIGLVVGVPMVIALFAIPCAVLFFAGMVVKDHVVPFLSGSGWEEPGHKCDRLNGWKTVKPYDVTKQGVELGWITVPGHTQETEFFLWGIPKDSYFDEGYQPQVRGEMDRSATNNKDVSLEDLHQFGGDLSRLALSAFNHGYSRVILTSHSAYAVGSEEEDLAPTD